MSDRGTLSTPRCGRITNPGNPYPLPCVKPKGHEGACDPKPRGE